MSLLYKLIAAYRLLLPDAAALEFTRIQEEWVAYSQPYYNVERTLPPLIHVLGADRQVTRDNAEQQLAWQRLTVFPALVQASVRHHDAEVRDRAARLVQRIFRCPYCKGTGACPGCEGKGDRGSGQDGGGCKVCRSRVVHNLYICGECEGSGDIRYYFDGIDDVYRQRELFGNQNLRTNNE